MVHDPRAPQLAAVATLIAAVLVLLTALNLVLNVVGSSGLSLEEGVAVAGVALFLVVANLANKERAIPELTPNQTPTDVETFAVATTPLPSATQTDVNPTTASMLKFSDGATVMNEEPPKVKVPDSLNVCTNCPSDLVVFIPPLPVTEPVG